jgi:hypothetical protein
MDFFLRDGDETRLKNAQLADDMDLIYSTRHIGPWGPELVAVAMRSGAHVCWYCQELFNEGRSQLRPIEVRHGYTLILMHAGCIGKKPRSAAVFNDLVRGHQMRREATKIVKGSAALDAIRGESDSPMSLDPELFASARKALAEDNAASIADGYTPPGAPEEGPFEQLDEPLIQLAEGLDTVRSRETLSSDDGDNGAA